jgi:putative polyhydroxyalkanoate system protein
MAKIVIEQAHQLPAPVVRQRLDELQARLADKYGIEGEWVGDDEAIITGTGVKGTIRCEMNLVRVTLDLSFPVSLMADRIEGRVRQELGTLLTAPVSAVEQQRHGLPYPEDRTVVPTGDEDCPPDKQ